MAGRVRISVTNLLASQTPINFYGTPVDANYPLVNLRTPERGLKLYKSTTITTQGFVWDLGGAPSGEFGFLAVGVNLNMNPVVVLGDTVNGTWVTPPLLSSSGVREDAQTGRRGFGRYFKTWPYRYLMLQWGAVAPTDGQGVHQCGGFWFGPCLDAPSGLLALPGSIEPQKPRMIDAAKAGTFEEYADLGPPRAQWTLGRRAPTNRGLVAAGDDLEKWLAVDRQWGGKPAAILLNSDTTRYAYIARNLGELAWGRDSAWAAKNTIRITETLGP
jgi:hypothetical protein